MKTETKRKRTAVDASRGTVFMIEPEKLTLVTDKTHPLFDPSVFDPVDKELAASLALDGNIEEVEVRRNGEALEVLGGKHRVMAGLYVNQHQRKGADPLRLRVRVIDAASDADFIRIALASNLHREAKPSVKAQRLLHYLKFGGTESEAAVAMGVSPATIKNRMALMRCSAKTIKAVDEGVLPETRAVEMSSMTREKQDETLAEMVKNGTLRGEVGARTVKAAKDGKAAPSKDGPRPITKSKLRRLGEELNSYSGAEPYVAFINFILLGDLQALREVPGCVAAAFEEICKKKAKTMETTS